MWGNTDGTNVYKKLTLEVRKKTTVAYHQNLVKVVGLLIL